MSQKTEGTHSPHQHSWIIVFENLKEWKEATFVKKSGKKPPTHPAQGQFISSTLANLKSQRRVLLIQSGQVKGQLNINTRNWGKQTKARKIVSAGIHQTCTKRLVQYSIPMSSLGMLAGAPVDMIIPSSMFLYSTTSATSLSTSAMSPMSTG